MQDGVMENFEMVESSGRTNKKENQWRGEGVILEVALQRVGGEQRLQDALRRGAVRYVRKGFCLSFILCCAGWVFSCVCANLGPEPDITSKLFTPILRSLRVHPELEDKMIIVSFLLGHPSAYPGQVALSSSNSLLHAPR